MRIATYQAFQSSVSNLQSRYQTLSQTQSQMTSGLRVQVPSDDPVAAAQVVRSLAAQSQNTAQSTALAASQNDMKLAEGALGSASTLLQQARSLVSSAGNSTLTDTDRASIAQQLQGIRTSLLSLANTSDGNGRFVFGGQGSDTEPFVDGTTGVTYNGQAGQQQTNGSQPLPLTVDGSAAWMQAPDPSHPGSTLSVFSALSQTITALNQPGLSGTQLSQTVSQGLANIDSVTSNILTSQSDAGQALDTSNTVSGQLSQSMLNEQTAQSNAQNLDMTSAISNFTNQQTAYQAALKTYSLIQQMSLFNYVSPSGS
jgi:flagellar hook-associated protein 3 FlgL